MTEFTFMIAGTSIRVQAVYRSTRHFCRDYLTDATPDLYVSISPMDIETVSKNGCVDIRGGRAAAPFYNRFFETIALHQKVASALLGRNVIMLHGSAVEYENGAYIFTAKSGIGKTTHSLLWTRLYKNCRILNGDKPMLLFRDGSIFVCGTPWCGKEQYGVNEIVPLKAVCLLSRDTDNHIERIQLGDCFRQILNQCYVPGETGSLPRVVELLGKLSTVDIYKLGCNMEKEAAAVSFNAMVKKEYREEI